MKILEMNKNIRPREKLLQYGPENLSNNELLSILLRSGNKNTSALDLSNEIITKLGGIKSLASVKIEELLEIPGIKLAKASTIIASFELAKRSYSQIENNVCIRSAEDLSLLMIPLLSNCTDERLYVVFVNIKLKVLKIEQISIGNEKSVIFDIKKILQLALKYRAYGVFVIHNHPSGSTTPSHADIENTNRLVEAAKLMDIEVLDHLIIANSEYYSFFDK